MEECNLWNNGNPCMAQRRIIFGGGTLSCDEECPYYKEGEKPNEKDDGTEV